MIAGLEHTVRCAALTGTARAEGSLALVGLPPEAGATDRADCARHGAAMPQHRGWVWPLRVHVLVNCG